MKFIPKTLEIMLLSRFFTQISLIAEAMLFKFTCTNYRISEK